MEKRHNYVRKVAEVAVTLYLPGDKPNIAGLILAGSADFKTELSQSDMFDQRLQAKVIKLVDVSYGGENGFNQAIELAAESLQNVKFIQEKKLIGTHTHFGLIFLFTFEKKNYLQVVTLTRLARTRASTALVSRTR
jgi:peptide chain release factor subunit 1